jgi:hypothetical protein
MSGQVSDLDEWYSLDEIEDIEPIGNDFDVCWEQAKWFGITPFDPVWRRQRLDPRYLDHFEMRREDDLEGWPYIEAIAGAYRRQDRIPPVTVIYHGLGHPEAIGRAGYTCIDGLHRVIGALLAEVEDIPAWVAFTNRL